MCSPFVRAMAAAHGGLLPILPSSVEAGLQEVVRLLRGYKMQVSGLGAIAAPMFGMKVRQTREISRLLFSRSVMMHTCAHFSCKDYLAV